MERGVRVGWPNLPTNTERAARGGEEEERTLEWSLFSSSYSSCYHYRKRTNEEKMLWPVVVVAVGGF